MANLEKELIEACNQARLAFSGFVSVQSAVNKLDKVLGKVQDTKYRD